MDRLDSADSTAGVIAACRSFRATSSLPCPSTGIRTTKRSAPERIRTATVCTSAPTVSRASSARSGTTLSAPSVAAVVGVVVADRAVPVLHRIPVPVDQPVDRGDARDRRPAGSTGSCTKPRVGVPPAGG